MNQIKILVTFIFFTYSVFSQVKTNEVDTQMFFFPMKGDFIHYSLSHTMSNTKHDLKHYIGSTNSEFYLNFIKKSTDNYMPIDGRTSCIIVPPVINTIGGMHLTLPTDNKFLESSLLYQLLTLKKFKINSVKVDATLKLEINGDSTYDLCFSNFIVTMYGTEAGIFKQETLDLEAIYNEIKQKQSLDGKMYDRSAKNLMEIDRFVKQMDKLYFSELDKVIRMDN